MTQLFCVFHKRGLAVLPGLYNLLFSFSHKGEFALLLYSVHVIKQLFVSHKEEFAM